jgi:hypothetical protein
MAVLGFESLSHQAWGAEASARSLGPKSRPEVSGSAGD